MIKIIKFYLTLVLILASTYTVAQTQIIVPFPPGGGTDISAKRFQSFLASKKISSVIIYKPGAEGYVGTLETLKSNNNGSVFGVTTIASIAATLHKHPDLEVEFVSALEEPTAFLVAGYGTDIEKFSDFDAALKNNAGLRLGIGTVTQNLYFRFILQNYKNTSNVLLVPYKGTGQLLSDLLGKHIDLAIIPATVAKPNIDAGKLKLIASTRPNVSKNIAILPEKYKGMPDLSGFALIFPKGTPQDTVQLYRNLVKEYLSLYKDEIEASLSTPFPVGELYLKNSVDRIISIIKKFDEQAK